jgi:hypothetical protein
VVLEPEFVSFGLVTVGDILLLLIGKTQNLIFVG